MIIPRVMHLRLRRTAILLGIVSSAAALASCAPREKDRIALVGGNVIDGRGGPVLENAVVVVHQGRIESVAPRAGFKIPRTATEVDVSGRWIIPGLIDANARVTRWALARYIAAGVTSVRDVHGEQDSVLALREAANLAGLTAPRVYTAGAGIDGAPAAEPGMTEVRSEDQVRRAVDERAVQGVDHVVAYTHMTPALLQALLDEAGALHLRVGAQLGLTDARTASRMGVSVVEQLSGIPEAASRAVAERTDAAYRRGYYAGWTAAERGWATVDSASLHQIALDLAGQQVIVVPTLVLHETMSRLNDPALLLDPALKDVPDPALSSWDVPGLKVRAGWTDDDYAAFRAGRANQDLFIREFRSAGGILAAGSGANAPMLVPGQSLYTELELLVQAGLTPEDALRAATVNAARLLGADSLGTIAPGKLADLVVLSGDPRADISRVRQVERVMIRGLLLRADSVRAEW